MIQRLLLLLVTLFALYCGSAFALGLGEIELKSALNQRFEAEIILSNVGDLDQGEIIPNLASQEDFDRVGVNRDYHLIDLRFKARVREDGAHVVHITSSKPIIEPFLNFIVEAVWPTGRILREYIVLLDPPVFSSEGIEKIEPGISSGSTSAERPRSRSSNRREIPPAQSVSNGRAEGVVTQDEEYGLTGPGDTLWTIASKVRPNDRISVQQTMLALQRANPEAFINNNINLLKAGHVLRIPDESEIDAETSAEAVAEVRFQNQEFEDYRSGDVTQLDARRAASRSSVDSDDSDNGELKLLAADQSGARSGGDDARAGELEESLAVAREDLDRSRRANSELNVRLTDIDDQVETLNELVKLKDDQLAALRAELQRQVADPASQPAAPVVVQQQDTGSLFSNPLVLGGVGVLLIGLVAGALMMFRKRRHDFQLDDNEFTEIMIEEDKPRLSLSDDAEGSSEEDSEYNDEDVTPQTSDVIGEAEIYIAYGRFPQAISFLQNAIENEPQRADIQLRLLEVYVQTEDAAAFNLQYEQLRLLGDDDATREGAALQAEIPGAAETSAAAMDATIVSTEPIAAIEDSGIDDDLSFDLDNLDAEMDDDDLVVTADTVGLSLDEAMELGESDLDLDLDAGREEVSVESEERELELVEIDLDLDDYAGDGDDDVLDLDPDGGDLDLDLGDDDALNAGLDDDSLELGDDDSLELGDDDSLELGDDDSLELGDDDDALDLDLDLDDDDSPELDDDDALDLDLDDDDSPELGDDDSPELDDDDALDLDLDDDDSLELDDDDALDLGLDDDDSLELDDDDALDLDLDDDDSPELGDDDSLELGDDDSLELDDDEAIEFDLDDDEDLDLGEFDDDDDLNLDEDTSSKLDLARAYIEMGDNDGAKPLLQEVLAEGDDVQVSEANELLGNISGKD